MDEFWAFRADLYNPRFETVAGIVNAINYLCRDKRFVGLLPDEGMPFVLFSNKKFARYALELLEENGCPTDKHIVKVENRGRKNG